MAKLRGFLFDFGDTLVHHELFDLRSGNLALFNQLKQPPGVRFEELQKRADELIAMFLSQRDTVMLEVRCGVILKLVYESFGLDLGLSLAESERVFRQAAVRYRLADGIHHFLDVLDRYSIKKGVVSNTIFPASLISDDLESFGLKERFEFVIASSDYGLRKPHQMIFELAARKLGFDADQIWFAGDSQQYDVIGAHLSGMHPIWYNPTGMAGQPDLCCREIRHWAELEPVVHELFR